MVPNTLLQKAFIESHVERLPPHQAIFIDEQQTCHEAIKLLIAHKFGCLLVKNSTTPVSGIFTERDVVKKLWSHKRPANEVLVSEIMTNNPQTLKYHASVAKAIYLMHTGGFRHVPVLQRDNSWSIISVTDFIRFIHKKLLDHMQKRADGEHIVVSDTTVDTFLLGELSALKPSVPVLLDAETSCDEAVKAMIKFNTDCVVIEDTTQQSVSGIFTDRDLIKRSILNRDTTKQSAIKEVMTKNPTTLQLTASVLYALSAMTEGKFRHLPIVDFDEKIVGVLSIRNFLTILSGGIVSDLRAKA